MATVLLAMGLWGCTRTGQDPTSALDPSAFPDRMLSVAVWDKKVPSNTRERARREILDAYSNATLIVEGSAGKLRVVTESSTNGFVGIPARSCLVVAFHVSKVLRGRENRAIVLVAREARGGCDIDVGVFPEKGLYSLKAVLFLRPNERVSEWSGKEVWTLVRAVPVVEGVRTEKQAIMK